MWTTCSGLFLEVEIFALPPPASSDTGESPSAGSGPHPSPFLGFHFPELHLTDFLEKNNTRTCEKSYSTSLLGSLNRRQLGLPPQLRSRPPALQHHGQRRRPAPRPPRGPGPGLGSALLRSPCSWARLFSISLPFHLGKRVGLSPCAIYPRSPRTEGFGESWGAARCWGGLMMCLLRAQHTDLCWLAAQIKKKWWDWQLSKFALHTIAKRTVQSIAKIHIAMLFGANSPYFCDFEDLRKVFWLDEEVRSAPWTQV